MLAKSLWGTGFGNMCRPVTLALAALSLVLSTQFVAAADPMGSVEAVQGRPLAAGPEGSRSLSAGSAVFEGDTVSVGDGNAQITLDDGTRLVVGPSSRLLLQAYLRRNATTASKVGIKALRGTFRVITGKSPKSAYKISTSNATIGIRGTGFDFRVDDRTLLAVLEGAVRLAGQNGQVVNTQSGCGVAEAGANIDAKVLEDQAKADALNNELPFITDQSGLTENFQLPVQNCLTSLGSNDGAPGTPGIPPEILIPVVPAIVIPGVILGLDNKSKETPVSPDSPSPNDPSTFCPLPDGAISCVDNCLPDTCSYD
jgi:FecR protein